MESTNRTVVAGQGLARPRTLGPVLALVSALALAGPGVAQGGGPLCGVSGWGHLPRWIPPGTGAGDRAGHAVAIDGATAAVGAPGGDVVHLYERVGSTWTFLETLSDPNGTGNDFGFALELEEKFLVVGAPDDSSDASQAGVVHVFERAGASWSLAATLHDPTPTVNGGFGTDVGASGDWIGAGAPGDSGGGSVHVFRRDGAGVDHVHEIVSAPSDQFGYALAMREMPALGVLRLFVGDWGDNVSGIDAGMVRGFDVTLGSVVSGPAFRPVGLTGGDYFGSALDFDGARVVVGAYGDDSFGSNMGAAYVLDAITLFGVPLLSFEQKLYGCASDGLDNFGRTVAIDGERVAVGAPNDEDVFDPGGRAYVYRLDPFGLVWDFEDTLYSADGLIDDDFGWAVALQGDAVLVGARRVDEAASDGGAAYYVSLSSSVFLGGELPSQHLATYQTYGTSKPGTLGDPTLSTLDLPLPGELHILRALNGLPGAAPFLIWGLTPAAIPFDTGTLWVGDLNLLVMPAFDAGGTSPFFWTPPAAAPLLGTDIYMQAVFFDPLAGGALSTAQTNGLQLTLGY